MGAFPRLDRASVYSALSRLFFSAGLLLACVVSVRALREGLDAKVASSPDYLTIASTPVFELPPASPVPTHTPLPTAIPTATPLPPSLPPTRLSIPAIALNTSIKQIHPSRRSGKTYEWKPPAYAVGHHDTSGNPGEGRNIVLSGHNNTQGAVFRHLPRLEIGDTVVLYTVDRPFRYRVEAKYIIPYLGAKAEAEAKLRSYAAPTPEEQVTLISCWPYATNAHRIVVIAVPVAGDGTSGG